MSTQKKLAIAALFVALISVAVYGYCRSLIRADIANSKQIEAEMLATATRSSGRSAEFRQRYEQMSDNEKKQFRKSMMKKRQERIQSELTNFFSLLPKQRVALLDKKIRESNKRRKEYDSRGQDRRGGRGAGGPDRGPRKDRTPEQREASRNQMKRRMLDNTSPKLRAQMSEYRRAMSERREELGLPSRGRGRG